MRYKIEEIKFKEAVKSCFSKRQVLLKLGVHAEGGNYRVFERLKIRWGVDTSHFTGKGHLKGKTHNWTKGIPLDLILVKNSFYQNIDRLKKRLIKAKLLKYECYECDINTWRGKKLSLHLDHKNGIDNDHRLENLHLLCPNCHSQTKTYCRKKNALVA